MYPVTDALDFALREHQELPTFGAHSYIPAMIAATTRPDFYNPDEWRQGIALAAALILARKTLTIALRGGA